MGPKDSGDSSSIEDFVAESDEGKSALRAALDVEEGAETWSFDDIAVDSGTFGELVSRGIVEKQNGDYRLADPDGVRAVLASEEPTTVSDKDATSSFELPGFDVDKRALTGLLVSLAVVAGARMIGFERAFQNGYAISPANDPYYFRYWLDNLLASSNGITDLAVLNNSVFTGIRPFTHATNWFIAELLGGGEWAATTVAMWLPVVSAVVLGAVLYKLAVLLTRDPRVGIATVLVFALTPINVGYTSLGFFDHSYNQYLWLGVTLLTVGWLAIDLRRRVDTQTDQAAIASHLGNWKTWLVAGFGGLSIAFGTHAWGGSPLLLLPLAGYIGLRVPLDVRAGLRPLRTMAPIITAVMLGGVVSYTFHSVWGWHSTFVALTPLVVSGGSIGITAIGELWQRHSIQTELLLPVEIGVTAIGSWLFVFQILDDPNRVIRRAEDLFFRSGVAETVSLFTGSGIFGPLLRFGIPFFIGIGVLGWVGVRLWRTYEPAWLLIGTYTLTLLPIAGLQVRFGGQLALPVSVLSGFGIVYGLATMDLIRTPLISGAAENETPTTTGNKSRGYPALSIMVPSQRRILYVAGIGVVLFSVSLISLSGTVADLSHSPDHADAVAAIDTHNDQVTREYPENYVLSGWSRNRMYNYFVNGESQSYGYARNTYESFVTASDPDTWYDRLRGRVGYVVIDSVSTEVTKESTQGQLLQYLDSTTRTNPPAHYQLLYTDPDQSLAAYAVVPGARIVGETAPSEQVVLNTSLTVNGRSLAREWTVTADGDGHYAVTVPYPGQYRVGETTIEVPSSAVVNGTRVTAGEHAIN